MGRKKKPLRDEMPETAAFIDQLRAAFGADCIDESIRRGMSGEPGWFCAKEAGRVVGTPFRRGVRVSTFKNGQRVVIDEEGNDITGSSREQG